MAPEAHCMAAAPPARGVLLTDLSQLAMLSGFRNASRNFCIITLDSIC